MMMVVNGSGIDIRIISIGRLQMVVQISSSNISHLIMLVGEGLSSSSRATITINSSIINQHLANTIEEGRGHYHPVAHISKDIGEEAVLTVVDTMTREEEDLFLEVVEVRYL